MQITYPEKKPRINATASKEEIFCLVRKKWVVLTPEEWVRQNFLLLLTETLGYAASLIAVEKKVQLTELSKRFDIVVYDNAMKPLMLVECKEMQTALSENVMRQVLSYQSQLQAEWMVVTNGNSARVFHHLGDRVEEVDILPVSK